jgi:hypothetical protein
MTLNVGTLAGTLELDANPFERSLDRSMASGAQKAAQLGDKMSAAVTLPIVAAVGVATKSASDLQQAVGGTEAVFGEAGDAINDYAKTAASASGLSEREFREATTSIGGQLKRMTGDVDLAAEQSIKLTGVAADLAATYGGTTAEAVAALGSAFRGEADPAERFNLNLKIGAVNAKAVEMGLAATTSEVDDNARAQATLALIMEQSADAQGQFARESGSAAGAMQIARAEMENASAEIGSALLPLVADLAGGAADLAARFSELPDPVQKGVLAFAGLLAVTGPLLSMGGRLVTNWGKIAGAFDKSASAAGNLAGKLNLVQAGAVAVAAVAVGAAVNAWAREMNDASSDADEFVESFTQASVRPVESMEDLQDEIMRVGAAAAEMKRHGDEALNPFLKARYREAEAGLNDTRDALLETEAAASQLQAKLGVSADEAARMATSQDVMAAATDDATGAIDSEAAALADAEQATNDLIAATTALADELAAVFDPLFAADSAARKMAEAQQKVTAAELELLAAQQALNEAIAAHGPASAEAAEASLDLAAAQENLDRANGEAVESTYNFEQKQLALAAAVKENPALLNDAIATLQRWVAQGRISQEQADATAEEFRGLARDANSVPDSVGIHAYADTAEAIRRLRELDAVARSVGQSPLVNRSVRSREQLEGRWTGGPMMPGKTYLTGEHGPELIRMTGGAAVVENAGQTRQALSGTLGAAGGQASKVEHHRHVTVQYPPDRPSTRAISHELRLIELENS